MLQGIVPYDSRILEKLVDDLRCSSFLYNQPTRSTLLLGSGADDGSKGIARVTTIRQGCFTYDDGRLPN